MAKLLEAIAGSDSIDDRQLGAPKAQDVPAYAEILLKGRKAGIKGLKVGVLKEGFEDASMDRRVEEVVRNAIERFGSLGAKVEQVWVPL